MPPIRILEVGASQVQGERPTQEDRYQLAKPGHMSNPNLGLFEVYDGHAGSKAVDHVKAHLTSLLEEQFQRGDPEDYEGALRATLKDEDSLLWRADVTKSGATAVVALIDVERGLLIGADIGDSHMFLAERYHDDPKNPWDVRTLTTPHKPDVPSEQDRIEDAGARVTNDSGTPRIGNIAISRSIGDLEYKQPIAHDITSSDILSREAMRQNATISRDLVSNTAHTSTTRIMHRSILLLATDGIGETLEAESASRAATKMYDDGLDAQQIADEITRIALKRSIADNATVVVICMGMD